MVMMPVEGLGRQCNEATKDSGVVGVLYCSRIKPALWREQQKSPRWPLSAHLRNEVTIKPPCQAAWNSMPGPCEDELRCAVGMSLDARGRLLPLRLSTLVDGGRRPSWGFGSWPFRLFAVRPGGWFRAKPAGPVLPPFDIWPINVTKSDQKDSPLPSTLVDKTGSCSKGRHTASAQQLIVHICGRPASKSCSTRKGLREGFLPQLWESRTSVGRGGAGPMSQPCCHDLGAKAAASGQARASHLMAPFRADRSHLDRPSST